MKNRGAKSCSIACARSPTRSVTTGLGSVIAQQGDAGPRIMLDAHMDELGGMIRHIRPDGFISMEMLGYWLDAALPDQRWVILGSKGPVLAVTDIWDAHIAPHDAQGHAQRQELFFH